MTDLANLHSVKNRFLLRINNQTRGEMIRTFVPTFARDVGRARRLPDGGAELTAGLRLALDEPDAALGEAEGDTGEGGVEAAAEGHPERSEGSRTSSGSFVAPLLRMTADEACA